MLAVLPMTPTLPVWSTSNAVIAVLSRLRKFARLSVARSSWSRACSGDGVSDGVVKASVQRAKVIGADRRGQFDSQIGHGLTDVAIVVHDL